MPLVSRNGGLEMEFDTYPGSIYFNPDAKPVQITFQKECNMDPQTKEYKETIRRGVPETERMYWKVDPCYRIPHNRFILEDQERLLKYYKMERAEQAKDPDHVRTLFYEPDAEDIEVRKYGDTAGWHMPLWMLDGLIVAGALEEALGKSKLQSENDEKMLTEAGKAEFLKALKDRKDYEASLVKTEEEIIAVDNIKARLASDNRAAHSKNLAATTAKNKRALKREVDREFDNAENAAITDEEIKELVGGGNVS